MVKRFTFPINVIMLKIPKVTVLKLTQKNILNGMSMNVFLLCLKFYLQMHEFVDINYNAWGMQNEKCNNNAEST